MKASYRLTNILITLLYLLLSLLGWQSLLLVSAESAVDWSQVLHPVLLGQIAFFILAHSLIFLCVLMLCLSSARAVAYFRPRLLLPTALGVFFLQLYAITGHAVTYSPWLEIAMISDSFSPTSPYKTIGIVAFLLLVITTLASWLINLRTSGKTALWQGIAALFLLSPLLPSLPDNTVNLNTAQAEATGPARPRPDVILIGMDSVSLYQARKHADHMPFVNSLLESGHNYTQAFTPLGRTYAAWHSILSGRYPATSGVRFNLTEFKPEQIADMLPVDLKKLGYYNLYAQDERRFNNINEDFGFDTAVGPTVGAIDFVIPLFADHPFSSYLLNSAIGAWLFPSLHNNRVSSVTYQPETFVQSILQHTDNVSSEQPLFMAGHFCLAHFPYRWRSYQPAKGLQNELALYRESLQALDQQIKTLFTGLQGQGRLDNAIVVLLSDHGEGLGNELPLWTGHDRAPANQFGQVLRGHGNSLLSRDQNNVIINIRHTANRTNSQNGTQIDTPVSLVDIRPTILALLKQPLPSTLDGIAIPPAVAKATANRYLFMETGIMMDLPQPDATAEELSNKVKGISNGYTVNTAGRLVMSEEFIQLNIPKKQLGVIYNEEMLISDSNNPDNYLWINRADNDWRVMNSSELAESKHSLLFSALNCYRQQSECRTSAD